VQYLTKYESWRLVSYHASCYLHPTFCDLTSNRHPSMGFSFVSLAVHGSESRRWTS
jgi:hypothetical protein